MFAAPRPFRRTPVALAALLALPLAAMAQTEPATRAGDKPPAADSDRTTTLQQVIITSEKRRADAQKTSLTVQALSGEVLQREGKKRLDEAIDGLAGVQLQPAAIGMTINIRGLEGGTTGARPNSGFGQADAAANPGVAVIIDGVYQSRPEALRAGMIDTTRVEVLRGNQSTNLGGNAVVGALNVVTAQPTFDQSGKVGIELGNYNRRTINGVYNHPLTEDQAVRIAVQKTQRDGYAVNNGDNEDSETLRLRYRWEPTDRLNIVAGVEHSKMNSTGINQGSVLYQGSWVPYSAALAATLKPASQATNSAGCAQIDTRNASASPTVYATIGCSSTGPAYMLNNPAANPGTLFRNRANPWDDGMPADGWGSNVHNNSRMTTYSLAVEYDTPVGMLTVTPSYQDFSRDSAEPLRGLTQNLAQQSQKTAQLEVRLTSAEDSKSRLKWLTGANLFRSTADAYNGQMLTSTQGLPAVAAAGLAANNFGLTYWPSPTATAAVTQYNCTSDCYFWASSPDTVQDTHTVFGNLEYSVLPELRLLAGLRYQEDVKTTSSSVFLYRGADAGSNPDPTAITYGLPIDGQSARFNDTNYRVGLEYDLLPDVMVYGARSTGYQPGLVDFDALALQAGRRTTAQLVSYPQSKINQMALGFKSRWLDGRLQFNAEAFQTTFDYYQLNTSPVARAFDVVTGADRGGTCTTSRTVRGVLANIDTTLGANVVCVADGVLPNVRNRGVDLDFAWAVTPQDRIFLSGEYLETKVDNGGPRFATAQRVIDSVQVWSAGSRVITAEQAQAVVNNLASAMTSLNGYGLANSPRTSLTAAYQRAFTLPDGSRLTTRVQAVYKSEYWTSGQGNALSIDSHAAAVQPAYTQYNLFANWSSSDGKYELAGYVRNATNTVVLQNLNTGSQTGYWTVSLAPPRTYGLSASMRF